MTRDNSRSEESQVDPLLVKLLDDSLTESEHQQLAALLANDEQARRQYIEIIATHAALREELGAAPAESIESPPPVRPPKPTATRFVTFFRRPTTLSLSVAALVIALLVSAMAFMAPPFLRTITERDGGSFDQHRVVGRLTAMHEVVWTDAKGRAYRGAPLKSGRRLRLDRGLVEITYDNGVIVSLEGPCDFVVDLENAGTLSSGKLAARVPKGATGFTINTPSATIVDLGTEFGVWVLDETVDVVVFDGKVEARSADARKIVVVKSGQAYRFRPDAARPQEIAGTDMQFVKDVGQARRAAAKEIDRRYIAAVLADGPVAYWPLSDGRAGRFSDVSGNALNGQQSGQGVSAQAGPWGGAATGFDGSGVIETQPNELLHPTNGITVEAWVWIDDIPAIGRVASYGRCWGVGYCSAGQAKMTTDMGVLRFTYYDVKDFEFPVTLARRRWAHVAVAVDEEHIARLYINGQLQGEIKGEAPRAVRTETAVIGSSAVGSEVWNGRLAHVAVYDLPLTKEQIQKHVRGAFPNEAATETTPLKDG